MGCAFRVSLKPHSLVLLDSYGLGWGNRSKMVRDQNHTPKPYIGRQDDHSGLSASFDKGARCQPS